jgi:hypothetical protein
MKLELTVEAVDFIQQVLGELPTKTGAFLVMNEIARQKNEQFPQQPPQDPSVTDPSVVTTVGV